MSQPRAAGFQFPSGQEFSLLRGLGADDMSYLASYLEEVQFPAGGTIIREGACDRFMYLVVEGQARVARKELELATLGPGSHIGELSLVTGKPRLASVIAVTPVTAGRLTGDSFDRMSDEAPKLAFRLLSSMMVGLRSSLSEMNESIGMLLRERSLPRRTSVRIRIGDIEREVRTGTEARALLPTEIEGHAVVAALMDRRSVSLSHPLSSDCTIEALSTRHWEGQRILLRSLCLLCLEAAQSLDPPAQLYVGHSIGIAIGLHVLNAGERSPEQLATALSARMEQLAVENTRLDEELWTVEEARTYFSEHGWSDVASLLETWAHDAVPLVTYGLQYALSPGPLVPETGLLSERFRIDWWDGQVVLLPRYDDGLSGRAQADAPETRQAARRGLRDVAKMTQEQQRWLTTLGVASVGELNNAAIHGRVAELIRVSEGFQEKRIGRIADDAISRESTRIICIAGPSSAGKTTFIKRLCVQLEVEGLTPVNLSLDDYYVDRQETVRDADGEYDFEAIEALHLPLLREHTAALLQGKAVRTARYDFVTGKSYPDGGAEIQLRDRDILMLEGIHALNPLLLAEQSGSDVFRIFVCPMITLPFDRLTGVHVSDVRLLRRIVRDRHGRGHSAADTIARWPSVRRGERKHIFPLAHHAEAMFDSSLVYELSVLKVHAERYLAEVPRSHASSPTALRLRALVSAFVPISPDHVPPNSLLREFIGGSGFEY